jgi:uncharacterized membrane protein YbhN (UPF0104 family)
MHRDDCLDHPGESTLQRIVRKLFPLLRVVLACAIVTSLVIWVRPEELFERFSGIRPSAGLVAFAGTLLAYWLGAIRLRLLAQSEEFALNEKEAISLNFAAVFYGLFLPGGSATGWAVRLVRLARDRANTATALFVLACDRALATASLAAIGVIADLWLRNPIAIPVSVALFAVMLGTTLMAVFLLVPSVRVLLAPIVHAPVLHRFAKFVRKYQTPAVRPQYRVVVNAIFLSICVHLVGTAVWVLLARSVGIDVNLVVIAWVRSASMVVALFPVSVGGLGLRESVVMYLLASFGVSGAEALSLSLSVFTVTVLSVGLFGGLIEVWHLVMEYYSKATKNGDTLSK